MANHPPTRAYVARQTTNGRSKREIIRMLKRAIAREIYRLLTHPADVPNYADLRAVRQARTSPSPPGTSTSGPPSSPGSSAGCAATTTSPGNTEPGSRPPDHPRGSTVGANQAEAQARSRCSAPRTNDLDSAEHRPTITTGGNLDTQ